MPSPSSCLVALLMGAVGMALAGCGGSGSGEGNRGVAAEAAARAPETSTSTRASVVASDAVFTDPRFGFDFRYPRDWLSGDFTYDTSETTGAQPAASVAVGIDAHNSVLLTRYNLAKAVPGPEVAGQLPELNGVVSRFAGRSYVGQVTEIGGLPGVRFEPFPLPGDTAERSSRIVFLFDGAAEYELNCQSTPTARDRLDQGCDRMLATLRRR